MSTIITPVQPETQTFEIADGPNAERLVDAFKYAFTKDWNARVTFAGPTFFKGCLRRFEHEAQVVGLSYDSGSEGSFTIMVNIPGFRTSTGHYNAQRRTGRIELIKI